MHWETFYQLHTETTSAVATSEKSGKTARPRGQPCFPSNLIIVFAVHMYMYLIYHSVEEHIRDQPN